jgi:PadR family transcriptional regulator, regulatory protein PadR
MVNKESSEESSAPKLPSLSPKEALILQMLISRGRELFGLEMVDESGGELKRGTIYVTLQRMKEKGFIDSRPEARPAPEVGIARRLYRITGYGERVYAAYQAAHSLFSSTIVVAEE